MTNPPSSNVSRVNSVDIIRGAVMILMAIDHVRVYAGVPAGGPDLGIFFTRWITHFCAPAFVFLAGTSAFFYGRKHPNLSRFLLTRGGWLIFLELTFLRLAWTFNLDFAHYELAGVIWAIGWCMIFMAGLVKLPAKVVGLAGVVIIAGHNVLDSTLWSLAGSLGNDVGAALWKILYVGFYAGPISFGSDGPNLIVLYSLFPWIGVMAAGYGLGTILVLEPAKRDRYCLSIGIGAIVLFFVLRGFNLYGDPIPWGPPSEYSKLPAWLSFLNATKYPASLSFLLMTLGPTIALIPALERSRGWAADAVALFGRVPFFFYMLHIPLIHVLALGVSFITLGEVSGWLFANHPMGNPPPPDGYTWGLSTLYLVWAITITILYFACRWFANVKSRRSEWWLKYL
ncbi:MAG: heparan-alpha-glucosaminide N-acetyltransferase domain-containing protein [Bacteroidota bacterium]